MILRLIDRARQTFDVLYREMLKFGVVGAVAFVVDIGLFVLLRNNWHDAQGNSHPLKSKIISVAVATVVAYIGNRLWTFRHRRQAAAHREFVQFVIMNIIGMLIAVSFLAFTHYLIGWDSKTADFISGSIIGTALGTLFRFWAYRRFVFNDLVLSDDAPTGTAIHPGEIADEASWVAALENHAAADDIIHEAHLHHDHADPVGTPRQ